MKIEKNMLNLLYLPEKEIYELQKYMTYVKEPKPYVMQSHQIGKSQHLDFRMKMNGFLEGWSIVGGNIENPVTPQRLLEQKAKGFRAETKAKQPVSWLKVEGEVKPGEVGAAIEKPGRFTILSKGQFITGTQKPYFHEYFIKGKHFPEWTRIVVRGVKVKKLDPRTKRPIPGRFERMWRIMITKTKLPYALSSRAMKVKWRPPRVK